MAAPQKLQRMPESPIMNANIVLARQVTAARSVVCPPDSMLAVVHSMPLLAPLALVNDDELTG